MPTFIKDCGACSIHKFDFRPRLQEFKHLMKSHLQCFDFIANSNKFTRIKLPERLEFYSLSWRLANAQNELRNLLTLIIWLETNVHVSIPYQHNTTVALETNPIWHFIIHFKFKKKYRQSWRVSWWKHYRPKEDAWSKFSVPEKIVKDKNYQKNI